MESVLSKTGLTAKQIDSVLAGSGLAELGSTFKQAESETGIRSDILAAIAIHESGWGRSNICKYTNNIFGFRCYDRSPGKSAMNFESKEDCILFVAKYLKANYLTPEGKYFNGYSLDAIGHRWASDSSWSSKVEQHRKKFDQFLIQMPSRGVSRKETLNMTPERILPVQKEVSIVQLQEISALMLLGLIILMVLRKSYPLIRLLTSVPYCLVKAICFEIKPFVVRFWSCFREDVSESRKIYRLKRVAKRNMRRNTKNLVAR